MWNGASSNLDSSSDESEDSVHDVQLKSGKRRKVILRSRRERNAKTYRVGRQTDRQTQTDIIAADKVNVSDKGAENKVS
jgi:hypothetical protein